MENTKFINIISGKGGTGKTLLSATIAELLGNQNISVLIIDMDFFVRGLTSLLYFHREEKLHLIGSNEFSVIDYFNNDFEYNNKKLSISRYRSFDISPSVPRIDAMYYVDKITEMKEEVLKKKFNAVISEIPYEKNYDYVIFDSRAGYDKLIKVTTEFSDITICIQEEDNISDITANNLIKQLEKDIPNKPILRVVNKVRNVENYRSLAKRQHLSLSFLGSIPFDMDVLNNFGEQSFWDEIPKSIYKNAVVDFWNNLSNKMGLNHTLKTKRVSPFINESIEKKLTFMSTYDRIIFLYGMFLTIGGFGYFIYPALKELLNTNKITDFDLIALAIGISGFIMLTYSMLRRQKKKTTHNKL
jgi:septum site-determining protein MinD